MNAERTARLEKKITGLARTRYVPEFEPGEPDGLMSQIDGVAWLAPETSWPLCKSCKRPMHLLLQLLAQDAPPDTFVVPRGKVAQVFHCGRESCDQGDTSTPDGHGKLVRFIDATSAVRASALPPRVAAGRRIVGFVSASELPESYGLHRHAAAKLNAKEMAALTRPYGKTKLGGWPDWIQGPATAICRRCLRSRKHADAEPMRFVLQLDGGRSVGFGGSGLAYVHQCPRHPNQVAMGWSST